MRPQKARGKEQREKTVQKQERKRKGKKILPKFHDHGTRHA